MRVSRQLALLTLALCGILLATGSQSSAREVTSTSPREREIDRIKSHFDSVLTELASADISTLSSAQRARRGGAIAKLAAYRDRGVFPRNYDFPGQAVPYFVDRKTGTLCAVAHLMATDGRRDVVDRVAAARNNVWVAELAGDTAFLVWLDETGFTLAEAARIQVPYVEGEGPLSLSSPASGSYLVAYTVATTGALASTLVNATFNRAGNSRVLNGLGFVLGATSTAVGLVGAQGGAPWPVAAASTLVGVSSMAISVRGIARHNTMKRERMARAAVAPIVTAEGKTAAAMSVSIPF